MRWFKAKWHWALYAITLLNYAALVAAPFWLGRKLGCAVCLPDLNPLFSARNFDALRKCLGEAGMTLFGRIHTFGADLTFPTLVAMSLIVLTLGQASHLPRFAASPVFLKIALVAFMPLAYAVSDYAENMLVWQWLISARSSDQTDFINVATSLKFTFLTVALAILALFILAKLKHHRTS